MTDNKKILITGSESLLGHYLRSVFADCNLTLLGTGPEADFRCNLESETPRFTDIFQTGLDLVIHAFGTEDEARALNSNYDGTRRLLAGLATISVKQFVYVSSCAVYGKSEGVDIGEEEPLRTADKKGQSQALAEDEVQKFCDKNGIICTIVRPVTMFGKDMKGWGERMAAQVLAGTYFNIRECDADISIVTALDVARVIRALAPDGGVYNVTDGHTHSLRSLALSMGNNRGKAKKAFWLPLKWARLFARVGDRIAPLGRILDSRELHRRTTSATYSSQRLRKALPYFRFHDTEAVISRQDPDYPYEDD